MSEELFKAEPVTELAAHRVIAVAASGGDTVVLVADGLMFTSSVDENHAAEWVEMFGNNSRVLRKHRHQTSRVSPGVVEPDKHDAEHAAEKLQQNRQAADVMAAEEAAREGTEAEAAAVIAKQGVDYFAKLTGLAAVPQTSEEFSAVCAAMARNQANSQALPISEAEQAAFELTQKRAGQQKARKHATHQHAQKLQQQAHKQAAQQLMQQPAAQQPMLTALELQVQALYISFKRTSNHNHGAS